MDPLVILIISIVGLLGLFLLKGAAARFDSRYEQKHGPRAKVSKWVVLILVILGVIVIVGNVIRAINGT